MNDYKFQVMPNLSADEYAELREDIKRRGVMVPIEFDENGVILDGHHRLQICEELGIKNYPRVIRAGMTDEEKRTHARKLNMARRHLTQEQKRGLICEQLKETPEKSDRQIAKDLGVHQTTVGSQRKKLEEAGQVSKLDTSTGTDGKTYPRKVEHKPVSVFNPTTREAKSLQNPEVVERIAETNAKPLTAVKQIQQEQRAKAIQAQIDKPRSTGFVDIYNTDKKYRVVYADPPWSYGDKQNIDGLGGAEKHYTTMPLDEICKLPVPTQDNAVLFIWVTSPMLEDVFAVIKAWGFKYKTSFVWDKVAHNMGHYNSVRHELLLIATKGSCTPDVKKLYDSVVSIERTEHSKKPSQFREMIDTLYPTGDRIELFAREAPDNWDVWGNMA